MSSPARSVVLCQRAAMPLGATAFLQRGLLKKPTSALRRERRSDSLAAGMTSGGFDVGAQGARSAGTLRDRLSAPARARRSHPRPCYGVLDLSWLRDEGADLY